MQIKEKIEQDVKTAMKNKDIITLRSLRAVKTVITNTEKIKKGEITDVDVINIIKKQIKQRKDSIESFKGRSDLIDKEREEINILTKYIPKEMSKEDIETHVKKLVDTLKITETKLTGKHIGILLNKFNNKFGGMADNGLVVKIIKNNI